MPDCDLEFVCALWALCSTKHSLSSCEDGCIQCVWFIITRRNLLGYRSCLHKDMKSLSIRGSRIYMMFKCWVPSARTRTVLLRQNGGRIHRGVLSPLPKSFRGERYWQPYTGVDCGTCLFLLHGFYRGCSDTLCTVVYSISHQAHCGRITGRFVNMCSFFLLSFSVYICMWLQVFTLSLAQRYVHEVVLSRNVRNSFSM